MEKVIRNLPSNAMTTSRFHHVYYHRQKKKWLVKLHLRHHPAVKETLNLGGYDDEETAARVADVAELIVARTNPRPRGVMRLNFDGNPPPSVPLVAILIKLLDLGILTRDQFRALGDGKPLAPQANGGIAKS